MRWALWTRRATLGVLGAGKFVLDSLPEAKARPSVPAARNIPTAGTTAVVIVRSPCLPHQP